MKGKISGGLHAEGLMAISVKSNQSIILVGCSESFRGATRTC